MFFVAILAKLWYLCVVLGFAGILNQRLMSGMPDDVKQRLKASVAMLVYEMTYQTLVFRLNADGAVLPVLHRKQCIASVI